MSMARASAILALPSVVLGPVDSPPWNRQRRFPGVTHLHRAVASPSRSVGDAEVAKTLQLTAIEAREQRHRA
jgi:hypothetical protein